MTVFHLNVFQLIAVPLVALLFVRSIILLGRANHRRAAAIWAFLWLAAGITVLRPGTTMWAARVLGIGRGTDLVLYIFVITFLIAASYFYNRVLQLEAALTEVVRQLALCEPAQPAEKDRPKFVAIR